MSPDDLWGGDEIATLAEMREAQSVLASKYTETVLRTLLVRLAEPLEARGAHIYLKLESLQNTGSFKVRGLQYKMHTSDLAELRANGVVTMSAGNAGKAVAYLARANGFGAKIFMPDNAPVERRQLIESYGASVEMVPGPQLLERVSAALDEGGVFVHPFGARASAAPPALDSTRHAHTPPRPPHR